MSDSSTDPAAAWDAFCDSLKRAGDVLRGDSTALDDSTRAEGYRYLARMARVGLELTLELSDPLRPALVPMAGRTLQYEGITSDARYLHGLIDGALDYRIRGWRGDAPWLEVGVYTGKQGLHEPSHLISSLTEESLEVDAEGRLEVAVGPSPCAGNWIETDRQARYLMIRQYAADWGTRREGQFTIEHVPSDPAARGVPLTLARARASLEAAAEFVADASRFWAGLSDYWAGFALNRFVPVSDADARTDVAPPSGHAFSCGYFRIEPDEALEIRFRPEPGAAAFWGLGLANYWYETVGYGTPESQLNSGNAQLEPDGSVRAVISHSPTGAPNWIDTKQHREGTMIFRWSRSSAPPPAIECRKIPLAQDGS